MATVTVIWDDAAIRMSTESEHNAIGRAMRRLADRAVLEQKRRCPVYSGPPRVGPVPGHPRQVARRSGTLRSSIRAMRQRDGSYLIGPTDLVGGQLLGPMLEHGTRPHRIESHGRWPLYSAPYGRSFGRVVNHPGTAPHPFIDPTATAMSGTRIHL